MNTLVLAPPSPAPALARAALGLAALGLAAGLGTGSLEVALRAAPAAVAGPLGAFLLTGPALLVAHEHLRLEGGADGLLAALAEGLTRAGAAALGLAPVQLFFSATTGRWGLIFTICAALSLGMGLAGARDALRAVWAGEGRAPLGLATAWALLAALITLRLAVDLAAFTLTPVQP